MFPVLIYLSFYISFSPILPLASKVYAQESIEINQDNILPTIPGEEQNNETITNETEQFDTNEENSPETIINESNQTTEANNTQQINTNLTDENNNEEILNEEEIVTIPPSGSINLISPSIFEDGLYEVFSNIISINLNAQGDFPIIQYKLSENIDETEFSNFVSPALSQSETINYDIGANFFGEKVLYAQYLDSNNQLSDIYELKIIRKAYDIKPIVELKAENVLLGGEMNLEIKFGNIGSQMGFNGGVSFELPQGFSYINSQFILDGKFKDCSIEYSDRCISPDLQNLDNGNTLLNFRSVADLESGDSKTFYAKIKVGGKDEGYQIDQEITINANATLAIRPDFSSIVSTSSELKFRLKPFNINFDSNTQNDREVLVGDTIENVIEIQNNPDQDSAVVNVLDEFSHELINITQTILEFFLGEGATYVEGSQRVENYVGDPEDITFNQVESITGGTIQQWIFNAPLVTEYFTNPLKILFETTIPEKIEDDYVDHNQELENRVDLNAYYELSVNNEDINETGNSIESQIPENIKRFNDNETRKLIAKYFRIDKTCSPHNIFLLSQITCSIRIKSSANYNLSSIDIEDILPDGFEYAGNISNPTEVSLFSNNYSTETGQTILKWRIFELTAGEEFTFSYVVNIKDIYSNLNNILSGDVLTETVKIDAVWQNTNDTTWAGQGIDENGQWNQVETPKIEVNPTTVQKVRVGDIVNVNYKVTFPQTSKTKNFELKVFTPVGTELLDYNLSVGNPSSLGEPTSPVGSGWGEAAILGGFKISFSEEFVEPNTILNLSYKLKVLDDSNLKLATVVRNLFKASFESSNTKREYTNEIVLELIEPKLESNVIKTSGYIAKGETVNFVVNVKNTGTSLANLSDISINEIPFAESITSSKSFTIEENRLVFTEFENIVLQPDEEILIDLSVEFDDEIIYGNNVNIVVNLGEYSNRTNDEITSGMVYRKFEKQSNNFHFTSGESLLITRITAKDIKTGNNITFEENIINKRNFKVGRNSNYEISKIIETIGNAPVYFIDIQESIGIGNFLCTNSCEPKIQLVKPNENIDIVLDESGYDIAQLLPGEKIIITYEVSTPKFIAYDEILSTDVSAEGLNKLGVVIRKSGQPENWNDYDIYDSSIAELKVTKLDFTNPVLNYEFRNSLNEVVGFINEDTANLYLNAFDADSEVAAIQFYDAQNDQWIGINSLNELSDENKNALNISGSWSEWPFENNSNETVELLNLILTNEGLNEFKFRIIDIYGNIGEFTSKIVKDTRPPALVNMKISPFSGAIEDSLYTNKFNNYINFIIFDYDPYNLIDLLLNELVLNSNGGYFSYSFDNENYSDWKEAQPGINSIELNFPSVSENEDLRIWMRFKDLAGNVYEYSDNNNEVLNVLTDTIIYSTQKPVLKFEIDGEYFVNNLVDINLELLPSVSGVQKIRFGKSIEDIETREFFEFNSLPEQAFLIDAFGTGKHQLCAQVIDNAGNVSELGNYTCDFAITDNLAPVGDFVINNGESQTKILSVELNISAEDPSLADNTEGVGIDKVCILNNAKEYECYIYSNYISTNITGKSGENFVTIKLVDKLGNESQPITKSIEYNGLGGNGGITINNDDVFTPSPNVLLDNLKPPIDTPSAPVLMRFIENFGQTTEIIDSNNLKYLNSNGEESNLLINESDWSEWYVYKDKIQWQLDRYNSHGYGFYSVIVQYLYADVTLTGLYYDNIIYTPVYNYEHVTDPEFIQVDSEKLILSTDVIQVNTQSKFQVKLNIKNTGSLTWLQSILEGDYSEGVSLSYIWKSKSHLIPGDGPRGRAGRPSLSLYRGNSVILPQDIYYNDSTGEVILNVDTPNHEGEYELIIDAIHEGIAWFSDFRVEPKKYNFFVSPHPTKLPIQEGIDPETGLPIDRDLPENAGGYYKGQVVTITGLFQYADTTEYGWPAYMIIMNGVRYYFVGVKNPELYLDETITATVVATGVGWNYDIKTFTVQPKTFSAELYSKNYINPIHINRGKSLGIQLRYLNTGSGEWKGDRTYIKQISGTGAFTPYTKGMDQFSIWQNSVGSFTFNLNIPSDAALGRYSICYEVYRNFAGQEYRVNGNTVTQCLDVRVEPTEAEKKQMRCASPQNVYSEPIQTSNVIGQIFENDEFIQIDSFTIPGTPITDPLVTPITPPTNIEWIRIYYPHNRIVNGENIQGQEGYVINNDACFDNVTVVSNPIEQTTTTIIERPTGDTGIVVNINGVSMRIGPSMNFPEVCKIEMDDTVRVIGQSVQEDRYSGWLKIVVEGNSNCNKGAKTEGWVPIGFIDHTNNPPVIPFNLKPSFVQAHVCGGTKNIRTGPVNEYPAYSEVLGTNKNFNILMEYQGWYLIYRNDRGETGWVSNLGICRGYYNPPPSIKTPPGNVGGLIIYAGMEIQRPVSSYTISGRFTDLRFPLIGQVFEHAGTDYKASCGTPVYAISDGVVSRVVKGNTRWGSDSSFSQYANFVYIDHPNGMRSAYVHLRHDVPVAVGQSVKKGQIIGYIGLSGWTTGCHLHFEIWANKNDSRSRIDPEQVFAVGGANIPGALAILMKEKSLTDFKASSDGKGVLHEWCGTWMKDYDYTRKEPWDLNNEFSNIIYNPKTGLAYIIKGDIRLEYWNSFSGTCGRLGNPTGDQGVAGTSPYGTTGYYQTFDNGHIYKSKFGTFGVLPPFVSMMNSSNGTWGVMGFPKSNEYWSSSKKDTCQMFEIGEICSKNSIASLSILSKERQIGNASRKTNEFAWCGGTRVDYRRLGSWDNASIVFNPSKNNSYVIAGGIAWAYWNYGGCPEFGLPVMDENRTGGVSGWYQDYQRSDGLMSTIYWDENNSKSQPGIVKGSIRDHFNSLGGTWSYLKFPEGRQLGVVSLKCNSSISGAHQNFNGGKIYISPVGNVDMPWNSWLNHYIWTEGEMTGRLGWPKSKNVKSPQGIETMSFETGLLYWQQGALGIGGWIATLITGCGQTSRQKDAQTNAPQCIKEGIWRKEDNFFGTYVRLNNDNGVLHRLNNNLWIVDYEAVTLKSGAINGWSVLVGNESNCSVYYVGGKAWDWYRDGNKWNSAGAPISDTVFGAKPEKVDGSLDYQYFQNATYTYSYNLKYGGGILGLGEWTNRHQEIAITNKNIHNVYLNELLGNYDRPGVNGFIGAPVESNITLHLASLPGGKMELIYGQKFQGGYIAWNAEKNEWKKVLNSYGGDIFSTEQTGKSEGDNVIISFINGLIEGVKSLITIEDIGDLFDIAITILSTIFGGVIGALIQVIGFIVSLGIFLVELVQLAGDIIKLFADNTAQAVATVAFIAGAVIGAVLVGSRIGGSGEAVESATKQLRKLAGVGKVMDKLSSLDIELPAPMLKRFQDIAKTKAGGDYLQRIFTEIDLDPSLLNRISGDINKLTDSELESVIRKVRETGKTLVLITSLEFKIIGV